MQILLLKKKIKENLLAESEYIIRFLIIFKKQYFDLNVGND